jgi:L-threonylcarbamoyladenylate synthase
MLFPTDTVAGIGCLFDSIEGISRIRDIKNIKSDNPLAVLIPSVSYLDSLKIRRGRIINRLIERLWPGGLTIVLSSENNYACSGEGNTMGLRIPDADLMRKIIKEVGKPIVATSANFHGDPPPPQIEDVRPEIVEMVDYVVDLPVKGVGLPSTVVKIEAGDIKIIRRGAVSSKEINEAMKGLE